MIGLRRLKVCFTSFRPCISGILFRLKRYHCAVSCAVIWHTGTQDNDDYLYDRYIGGQLDTSIGRGLECPNTDSEIRNFESVVYHGIYDVLQCSCTPLEVIPSALWISFITTSTTFLNPSISSSTVPPMPALAKLIELPTYTGLFVLLAKRRASRVVNSNDDSFE